MGSQKISFLIWILNVKNKRNDGKWSEEYHEKWIKFGKLLDFVCTRDKSIERLIWREKMGSLNPKQRIGKFGRRGIITRFLWRIVVSPWKTSGWNLHLLVRTIFLVRCSLNWFYFQILKNVCKNELQTILLKICIQLSIHRYIELFLYH